MLLKATPVLVAGLAVLANLPTRLWMPAKRATLPYLAETMLENIDSKKKFKVRSSSYLFVIYLWLKKIMKPFFLYFNIVGCICVCRVTITKGKGTIF